MTCRKFDPLIVTSPCATAIWRRVYAGIIVGQVSMHFRKMSRRSPSRVGLVLLCMVALLAGSMWGGWSLSARASGGNPLRGLPVRVKHIIVPLPINYNKPVLAFYYMWYHQSDWCSCHMSDLPATQYDSSNDSIIDQQVNEAANAGITGFISSWWGPGRQYG